MKKTLIKLILQLIAYCRTFYSPWIYKKFYHGKVKYNLYESEWLKSRDLDMEAFSLKVNSYGYLWDAGKGIFDASFPSTNPSYFFASLRQGRDCDDFARIWRLWGEHNGYVGYEYIVTDVAHPFSKAHVVTLLEKDGRWWLMNYLPYGPTESREAALGILENWYKNLVVVQYHHEKEKEYNRY